MRFSINLVLILMCMFSVFLSGCLSQSFLLKKNETPYSIIGNWQYGSVSDNWSEISPGGYSTVSFKSNGDFSESSFGQVIGPGGQPDTEGPIMGTAPIQSKWVRQLNGTYLITASQFGEYEQLWVYSPSQDAIYSEDDKQHVYFRTNSHNSKNKS